MVAYTVSPPRVAYIATHCEYSAFRMRPKQAGYLQSTYPDHIVSEDGVPTQGQILVFLRVEVTHLGVGYLVAHTVSASDGTWRIDGLNPDFTYDVVCRKPGYNDIIFANISPLVD